MVNFEDVLNNDLVGAFMEVKL